MRKFLINLLFFNLIFCFNLYAQGVNEQRYRLAESYEQNGDMESALRIYSELTNEAPKSDKYFMAYARVMKEMNKYSELLNSVKERIANKENFDLLDLYAELSWRVGNTNEANNTWTKILDKYSKEQDTYLKISQSQINLRLYDKAIETLLLGRSKTPKTIIFDDPLVKLYLASGNYQDGTKEILSQFRKSYNKAQTQGRLYALMVNDEANEYVGKELKKLAKDYDDNIFFQELYSWYLRTNGNNEESLDIVMNIDKLKGSKGLEILNFAGVANHDGDYNIAIKAYKAVIDMGKNSPYISSAIYGYTKVLEDKMSSDKSTKDKKDIDEIVNLYKQIIKDYPTTANAGNSRLNLARIYSDVYGDNDKAIAELEQIIKEFAKSQYSVMAYLQLAKTYISNDNMDKAMNSLSKFDGLFRYANPQQKDEFAYYKAMILYYNGDIEQAEKSFSALSLNPETDIANNVLKRLFLIRDNEQYVAALAIYSKAELREYQKRFDDAIDLFSEVAELADKSSLSELAIYKSAMIEFNRGKYQKCRDYITKLAQQYADSKENDKYVYLTAESYYYDNNPEEALKYYTELISKYTSSIYLQDSRKKIRIIRKDNI